ncbi:c-type cytochrome [Nitrosococcus watsonii]|uniref:Cytochrome c class I n=1 Tax=Nitrosococcus watsoni (strain C-113) TaxID=105559 RepID=D8K6Y0_NITWC|nr:c-type cytochrome [Nitrosococcus watsonii]ADJ28657.1 cytochrome c class I [Nitrosococcus watsonii C-113]
MNKQIHKMNFLSPQCLLSIMGMGIVTLSLLAAGCTEQTAETSSPEAIAKRIEPAGKVNIASTPEKTSETPDTPASSEEKSPAAPAPAKNKENAPAANNDETPPATKGKESQLNHGKTIVKNSCAACHTGNLPGAPVIGNAEDWTPRLTQGVEILTQHATQGYKAMPPKGGNPNLSDEDIAAAIAYFISQVKK